LGYTGKTPEVASPLNRNPFQYLAERNALGASNLPAFSLRRPDKRKGLLGSLVFVELDQSEVSLD
jgi:hypothetical protein